MNLTKLLLSSEQSIFIAVVLVWLIAISTGIAYLTAYSYAPGQAGEPACLSDGLSSEILEACPSCEAFHLVMAVHPRCACTRASLGELEKLLAKCGSKLRATILVFHPNPAVTSWSETGTVKFARSLPNARILSDSDGTWAKELGLKTSGAVILYSANKSPLFQGGITPSRNHHGDNIGSDAILSLVLRKTSIRERSPVYGCVIDGTTLSNTSDSEI